TVLVLLIALPLTGIAGPDFTVGHVHPTTFLLLGAAVAAFWLVFRTQEEPMWHPRLTEETVEDEPDP
ncbi:MAG: sodium:calcium antiporter, partial [Gemmatimonadetes bacterium]|nr:sodium:calcium antiporter [Gemmatimonadota bacterium]NIU73813.1 sodium:calcium antiporter [Gammaproteobacteria bacterium]NIT89532.1 sodium:calcium antiporter [Gemmatimonadota bacterium]NIW66379.1 sodium:calcium antiporter [Gemmatimonadota bacterium]NIX41654.1 sodium:calcium antiporter [Gemmatimonadota bacterium]